MERAKVVIELGIKGTSFLTRDIPSGWIGGIEAANQVSSLWCTFAAVLWGVVLENNCREELFPGFFWGMGINFVEQLWEVILGFEELF